LNFSGSFRVRQIAIKNWALLLASMFVLSVVASPAASGADSGELRWGVKRSFLEYVANIAKGEVEATGARFSNFTASFPQANHTIAANGLGAVRYSGQVSFTGHGQLLLTVKDPEITIESETAARLSVTTDSGRVHFANLNLASGQKSTDGSLVSYRGVATSLTAAGAGAFSDFYDAGQLLDDIAFSIQLNPAASGSAPGPTPTPTAAAPTAPSQTGTSQTEANEAAQTEADAAEVEVPQETAEPATENRGASAVSEQLGLSASSPSAAFDELAALRTECAADHRFGWGVKESFLAYLDSALASGGWQLASVAESTSGFDWPVASARFVSDTDFEVLGRGAVRFTGHQGQLDLLIANPTLTPEYLLVDFVGDSITGATTEQSQLVLARVVSLTTIDSGDSVVIDAALVLTEFGAQAFGFYAPETELAAVQIELFRNQPCVSFGSPSTGLLWVLGLAGLLVIAGAVFAISRKTRRSQAGLTVDN
jgi:hypothetical protein